MKKRNKEIKKRKDRDKEVIKTKNGRIVIVYPQYEHNNRISPADKNIAQEIDKILKTQKLYDKQYLYREPELLSFKDLIKLYISKFKKVRIRIKIKHRRLDSELSNYA